ncbi:hypothetical protein ACIQXI_02445 [Lysinibacillus sp. NPDC097195]|uniref:hypothetical protein n=1 Tax=Lysinibacillus sp. NPDC097195 TaxID=3364141 RepID=UPI003829C735
MNPDINQNAILQAILELSTQVQGVKTEILQKIEAIETRLKSLGTRQGSVETKLESLKTRIEKKIESVEQKLQRQISEVEKNLCDQIDKVETKMEVLTLEILETKTDVRMLKKAK